MRLTPTGRLEKRESRTGSARERVIGRGVFPAASLEIQREMRFAPVNPITQAPPRPHRCAPAPPNSCTATNTVSFSAGTLIWIKVTPLNLGPSFKKD